MYSFTDKQVLITGGPGFIGSNTKLHSKIY
jgi:FlaA1/EpsC-like NDP-sugar epimerase